MRCSCGAASEQRGGTARGLPRAGRRGGGRPALQLARPAAWGLGGAARSTQHLS